MNMFRAKDFFDLSHFAHSGVFEEEEPVWSALKRISLYLRTVPLGKIDAIVEEGAYLVHPELISIGPGTRIEAGAYIRGPCVVGKDCEIRHGAYIRGNFIAGDHCVIGHATEIKNALFLNGAQAGHFAYIGDSILGNRVNLGAGTKCANLRLDHQNVPVRIGDKRIDSGLKKFGAILGDEVQLGCNSVTNPGVLIGKKSGCFPCVVLNGYVPENVIVKSSNSKVSCHL